MQNEHEFDLLRRWSLLSDSEIQAVITPDNINVLVKAVELLGNKSIQYRIDASTFPDAVREISQLIKEGSQSLGEAILSASDYVDNRQFSEARAVYDEFLKTCKSEFYRKIALFNLHKIPK